MEVTLEAGLQEELEFVEEALQVLVVVCHGKSRVLELLTQLAHALCNKRNSWTQSACTLRSLQVQAFEKLPCLAGLRWFYRRRCAIPERTGFPCAAQPLLVRSAQCFGDPLVFFLYFLQNRTDKLWNQKYIQRGWSFIGLILYSKFTCSSTVCDR